jgi:glycosyltransferase involved in cell wall biosynthesis
MDPTVSIVVPAYNASPHLRSVVDRFDPALWRRIKSVWIINDGSSDDTGSVIDALAHQNKAIRPINFPENRGYGAAMREGLVRCREDGCGYAVSVHADGQYPPEAVLHFMETMEA